METGEINIFVGERLHRDRAPRRSAPSCTRARRDLESRESVLTHGPSAVVYAVCDRVVDGYLEVVESLEEDVDEVEASVFSAERTNDSERIYTLKREISRGPPRGDPAAGADAALRGRRR